MNATDRNVRSATGIWKGHITLPSSFLTCLLLLICGSFLLIINWTFEQTTQIRDRLRAVENLNARLLQVLAPAIPQPSVPPSPADAREAIAEALRGTPAPVTPKK